MVGHTVSHYKMLERLGEAGTGEVFKAEDARVPRVVALKFLLSRGPWTTKKGNAAFRPWFWFRPSRGPRVCLVAPFASRLR